MGRVNEASTSELSSKDKSLSNTHKLAGIKSVHASKETKMSRQNRTTTSSLTTNMLKFAFGLAKDIDITNLCKHSYLRPQHLAVEIGSSPTGNSNQ